MLAVALRGFLYWGQLFEAQNCSCGFPEGVLRPIASFVMNDSQSDAIDVAQNAVPPRGGDEMARACLVGHTPSVETAFARGLEQPAGPRCFAGAAPGHGAQDGDGHSDKHASFRGSAANTPPRPSSTPV